MTDTVTTTLDLLRHGEPVGGSRYRGQIDDPLSDKGWGQMRTAVGNAHPWDRIISSPLTRCSDFARELATRHALPLDLEPRLMELGFGEWEGRTAQELMRTDADILARFWRDPLHHTPPGAETLPAFEARVIAAWNDLLAQHRGQRLLLVCHAGVIRLLLSHALAMPLAHMFRIQVPNAGLSRLRVDHHLDGLLPRLIFHAGSLEKTPESMTETITL